MPNLTFLVKLTSSWFLFLFLIYPVAIPVVIIFATYRLIVTKSIQLGQLLFKWNTDLISPVLGLDIGFANDDFWSEPKGSIGVVHTFQNSLNPVQIENKLTKLFLEATSSSRYERLTSLTPVSYYGYSFWKKAQEFNIRNHIHVLQLSPNSSHSHILCKSELNKIISTWNSSPFKEGCPLWDILIIPSFMNSTDKHGEEFSVVGFRIHHMVGDGYSIRQFMENLFSMKDELEIIGKRSSENASGSPTNVSSPLLNLKSKISIKKFRTTMLGPATFLNFIYDFFLYRDTITTNPKSSLVSSSNGTGHVYASTLCSLKELKMLKQKLEEYLNSTTIVEERTLQSSISFGTLMLFLIGNALRKFLIDERQLSEKNLPSHINIAASLPIWNEPHPKDTFCNHWTHGVFKIPCGEPNPLTRLQNQIQDCNQVMASGIAQIHTSLTKCHHIIPNCIWRWLANRNIGTSSGFVNLPGPQGWEIEFCGAKLQQIIPIAGLQWKHTCMTVGAFSYNDTLVLTLLANQDFMTDANQGDLLLDKYLQDEIKEFIRETGQIFAKREE